jgi:hypothetical protein
MAQIKKEDEVPAVVMVVTVPPGDDDDEPHYACLLPVSTGSCKAFVVSFIGFFYTFSTKKYDLLFFWQCC